MTQAELQAHAARILSVILEDPEFSYVYEDDELAEATESDQLAVHNLIASAQVFATWPGADVEYQVAGEDEEA